MNELNIAIDGNLAIVPILIPLSMQIWYSYVSIVIPDLKHCGKNCVVLF